MKFTRTQLETGVWVKMDAPQSKLFQFRLSKTASALCTFEECANLTLWNQTFPFITLFLRLNTWLFWDRLRV